MTDNKTDVMRMVLANLPPTATYTFFEEPFQPPLERDVTVKLPVIDGQCKGQRMARPGYEFTFEVSSSISKTKTRVTYCLRRHRLLGLVWALPNNKSVSEIYFAL